MRAAGGLWPQITARENLRAAFHAASAGLRDRAKVREFAADLEASLLRLRDDMEDGRAPCGRFSSFVIHDPKRRTISAPCFEDRIAHHALMQVCEPVFERVSIFDSYACRTGKGQTRGLERARQFSAAGGWYLQLDVRKYFESIHRETLEGKLARCFREVKLRSCLHRVIHGFQPGASRGLPIGSLASQHFANFYLNPVDRLVKETLRCRRYLRYMDDFVLWDEDRNRLLDAARRIATLAAEELHLELKPPVLQRVEHGLNFTGYRIYPHSMIVNAAGRTRLRHRWRMVARLAAEGRITELEAQQRSDSLIAFTLAGKERCLRWRRREAITVGSHQTGPEPGDPRRQLEQPRNQLPRRQPQQDGAGQPQPEPRLPHVPQLRTE